MGTFSLTFYPEKKNVIPKGQGMKPRSWLNIKNMSRAPVDK